MWDTREKTPTVHEINFEWSNAHWTMDLCDTDLVLLSSGGDVLYLDTRKLKNVTSTNNIGLTTKGTDCLRICLKVSIMQNMSSVSHGFFFGRIFFKNMVDY